MTRTGSEPKRRSVAVSSHRSGTVASHHPSLEGATCDELRRATTFTPTPDRLRDQIADRERKRAQKAADRAVKNARRQYGLIQRHTTKLRRAQRR